jgi:hypothetical protein
MAPLDTWISITGGAQNLRTGETRSASSGGGGGGGGTPGWALSHTYNLTVDEGWTIPTGNRGLDSSYNRPQQASWDGSGMTITAERATLTSQIYSADAQARFYSIPNVCAVEADVYLGGYIGEGCFPALWMMPLGGGQGEIDIWELMAHQPSGNSHYKGTAIVTASGTSDYNRGQAAVQYDTSNGKVWTSGSTTNTLTSDKPDGFHTYRIEKTAGQISYFIDGVKKGTITQTQVDNSISSADKTAGYTWANQFESGHSWYLRFTYQFGPPTDGRTFIQGGYPPDSWVDPVNSWMRMSRAQVYVPA